MVTISASSPSSFADRLRFAHAGGLKRIRRATLNAVALVASEALALALCLTLAGLLRAAWVGEGSLVIGAGWAALPLYAATAALMRLYPGWGMGAVEEVRRSTMALCFTFGLLMVGQWLTAEVVRALVSSRFTLVVGLVLSIGLVPYARTRAKAALIGVDGWGVPAVIYGAGRTGARLVRQLQEERGIGYRPVAVFDDDTSRHGDYLDTIPITGNTDTIAPKADVAFLAMPGVSVERRRELTEHLTACYRRVLIIPEVQEGPSLWVQTRDIGGVLGLEITTALTSPVARATKRFLDMFVAAVTAPFWAPVVGAIALAIWLEDRASPFYTQERVGQSGRLFQAIKLRTMVPNADSVLEAALKDNPDLRAEWEADFKLAHDPRITRIGHLLRRTSLDELPQLFNVLRGEMSLVGPRPLPQYHHEELPERVRTLRERVRPGITGLWQISGRSDTGTAGMERWDPYYVRNWSLWLDAVILVRTLRVVARGSGAY